MNAALTCGACRDALPDYVMGALTPAARAAVQSHLATCASCQRELAQWHAFAQMTQASAARLPDGHEQAATTWAVIHARLLSESPVTTGATFMDFDHSAPQTDPVATPLLATPRRERPQPRRTPLFAVVAVVALAVLTASIFTLRPHGGAPGAGSHPSATPVPALTPPALSYSAASILSPTDVWAIGAGTSSHLSAIVHFDGHRWQTTADAIFADASLYGISMDSATDGWAVGSYSSPKSGPLLAHYTHGKWVQTTLPLPDGRLTDVQMLSAQAGWALGADVNNQSVFFHYSGGAWTKVPFAPRATATLAAATTGAAAPQAARIPDSIIGPDVPYVAQMRMLSDDEGWAVGTYHSVNLVWRYHAGQWSTAHQFSTTGDIFGLGVNAAKDVWVIGVTGPLGAAVNRTTLGALGVESFGPPSLQHFDGQAWTTTTIDASVNGPFFDGAAWLTGYGRVANTQAVTGLWHNQGGQWSSTPFPNPVTNVLSAVTLPDGSTLALAVTGEASGPQTPLLLRYTNGAWRVG